MACYDKHGAEKRDAKKRITPFSTQMLMLNSLENTDSRSYCFLDSGANAVVLPKVESMYGSDAQYSVPGAKVVPGLVIQILTHEKEEHHIAAIEGASPLMPLGWLVFVAGWRYQPQVRKGRLHVAISSLQGDFSNRRRSPRCTTWTGTLLLE